MICGSQINHSQHLQQELDQIISLKQHIKKYTNKQLHVISTKIEQKLQARKGFISDIPDDDGDILERAKASDLRNLSIYNGVFSNNMALKKLPTNEIYRKTCDRKKVAA